MIFNVYKSEDDNEDRVGENDLLIYTQDWKNYFLKKFWT